MFVGVVGLARVAGVFVARGQFDEYGPSRIEPDPEAATPRGAQQVLGDGGPDVGERGGGGATVPARAAGGSDGEAEGVARVVLRDRGVR